MGTPTVASLVGDALKLSDEEFLLLAGAMAGMALVKTSARSATTRAPCAWIPEAGPRTRRDEASSRKDRSTMPTRVGGLLKSAEAQASAALNRFDRLRQPVVSDEGDTPREFLPTRSSVDRSAGLRSFVWDTPSGRVLRDEYGAVMMEFSPSDGSIRAIDPLTHRSVRDIVGCLCDSKENDHHFWCPLSD